LEGQTFLLSVILPKTALLFRIVGPRNLVQKRRNPMLRQVGKVSKLKIGRKAF